MSEKRIQTEIMLAAGGMGSTLFRNNVGNGVLGKITSQNGADFIIKNGRRVQYGLCPGSSDLIGWKRVTITQDMVGESVAVFLAVEVKQPGGVVSDLQTNFLNQVRGAGGLAGIAHNTDEYYAICNPLRGI